MCAHIHTHAYTLLYDVLRFKPQWLKEGTPKTLHELKASTSLSEKQKKYLKGFFLRGKKYQFLRNPSANDYRTLLKAYHGGELGTSIRSASK